MLEISSGQVHVTSIVLDQMSARCLTLKGTRFKFAVEKIDCTFNLLWFGNAALMKFRVPKFPTSSSYKRNQGYQPFSGGLSSFCYLVGLFSMHR